MNELSQGACQEILRASNLGVLALAKNGDSYAIPLYFGYDGDLYSHCHPGKKDEYISTTSEATFLVTHVATENIWESVQVFGALQVLTLSDDIERAKSALFQLPFPPAEGNFPRGLPVRSEQQVYYLRLRPTRIVGVQSSFQPALQKQLV